MKFELLILGITAFFIFNVYHDGKYMKMLLSWKKYYQMAFFAILGISIYLLMKRNPNQCKNMLMHANNVVKYLPIDKSSIDMISPILDFTGGNSGRASFMESFRGGNNYPTSMPLQPAFLNDAESRIMNSGKTGTKRSVSETKKKYVASQQNWKCGECQKQLNAWFEVDHKKRLEYGGGNDVANLVALCRECHGKKTAMENM